MANTRDPLIRSASNLHSLRNTWPIYTSKSSLTPRLLFHLHNNNLRPKCSLSQHHARHHGYDLTPNRAHRRYHQHQRQTKLPSSSQVPLPPSRRHHPLAPTHPHPHAIRFRERLLPLPEAPKRAHVDPVRTHVLLSQGPARGH